MKAKSILFPTVDETSGKVENNDMHRPCQSSGSWRTNQNKQTFAVSFSFRWVHMSSSKINKRFMTIGCQILARPITVSPPPNFGAKMAKARGGRSTCLRGGATRTSFTARKETFLQWINNEIERDKINNSYKIRFNR